MLKLPTLLVNSRARNETAWVVAAKAAEFAVGLACVKLFTNLMSKEAVGEYQIALTSLALVCHLFEAPISQVYLRQYHGAQQTGTARSLLAQAMKWLGLMSILLAVGCALLTYPLGKVFGLGPFTVAAIGLIFATNSWRSVRVQVLDIQRERRRCMLENTGFFVVQTSLGALALWFIQPSATMGLLAYALAAGVFGAIGVRSFRQQLASAPDTAPAPFARLVYTYGLPLGILTSCQWLQMNGERYVLGTCLDYASVGVYVVAYQICGVPFNAMNAVLTTLVQPVAFQRAKDINDPRQVWSADRVLLAGIGLYVAAGVLIVAAYALWGPLLLRLAAAQTYVLPASTLTVLAAARMLMFASLLQHMIFKVHQQTRHLLWYSILGGLFVIGTTWLLVERFGRGGTGSAIFGAALAVLSTAIGYNFLLAFAPGGIWPLLREVRARLWMTRGAGVASALGTSEGTR